MILVAYDIANDKLRTKFANYLSKHGYRLQYSIFQIKNSKRILSLVSSEIKNNFEKKFSQSDSVIIFHLSENYKITKYGYAKNDDETLIVI
ncbi:CRISPR-associated endonuclease Cas2 [Aliarcobacter butzleri]|uniref:CRISPR-associated endoribonuclease Cas2 n=1 Tax=Aliarcobacter butzleri L348 TaxID=1447256 RepID=A0A0G9K669_9BACT|nr:CRISPR-associated endonuclease Cas2 [Aliarcobacter butzleri]KLE02044.1 CRISPR-associated protein Cas2 [Aliarcobacter butzleri L348]MCG3686484.1 CRISPR-associated endonuclease Cas2 [Aliarcobacter butzleri]NUW25074.1 CRISPR-associated endonuclease Cas2 [Aliarcobacter butzleri]